MDSVPTQTAGTSELLASDWNTYVRDNFDSIKFGHVVCTSSTRPTGIAEGTMIYETDTDKVLVYSGSAWVEISDITNGASNPIQRNVVTGVSTVGQTTTSSPFIDVTDVTATITPSSTSSKILVLVTAQGTINGDSYQAYFRVLRSSTAIGVGTGSMGSRIPVSFEWSQLYEYGMTTGSMIWLDSPSTTSATTYKLQWGASNSTNAIYLNRTVDDFDASTRARGATSITVIEIPA